MIESCVSLSWDLTRNKKTVRNLVNYQIFRNFHNSVQHMIHRIFLTEWKWKHNKIVFPWNIEENTEIFPTSPPRSAWGEIVLYLY